ncbi:MAG: polysaccharide biosynthesis protein [Lutibacter sp.]|nr:MAG: polysaccharide biosynthesis protein [Lutibacter sp.]
MLHFLIHKIRSRYTPKWLVLLFDLYIVVNTFLLAYLIRFNFTLNFNTSNLVFQVLLVLVVAISTFLMVGSFRNIIRHSGIRDALEVFKASFVILILLATIVLLNRQTKVVEGFTIPLSILVIHFLINCFALISSRYLIRRLYYILISEDKLKRKVLIYGAGENGMLTFDVLRDDFERKFKVLGFIDDNTNIIGKKIRNVEVYNPATIDAAFIKKKRITEIIISIQNIASQRLMEIVDTLSLLSIEVKIVPSSQTWINGNFKTTEIKKIKIEDLLGRTEIKLNNPTLKNEYSNKVVLITGAAGSIGSEIACQISHLKFKHLVLIDQAESELYNLQQNFRNRKVKNSNFLVADIRDQKRMNVIFKQYQPSVIFHAAAYKHVPFMEENPYEAIKVNIAGTKIMADLAIKNKVRKFVMISTDKAVNPTNIMGASKRIAELYINSLASNDSTKFVTTRFGNVLGSNGSVIPLFNNQIEKGGPITVTHKDIIRYFMTIPEACQLVLEAEVMSIGGEIFVFDMGVGIKIYDLALQMIRLSGLRYPEDITIKITGLRPGEKIYEELLADGENTIETHHAKIMIANVKKIDCEVIKQQIKDLCSSNDDLHIEQTVSKMKEIVPEFISNNSKYEELDTNKKQLQLKTSG